MSDTQPDSQTSAQLHNLGYRWGQNTILSDKPLLICDVDEVVLHLVDPFVEVLQERGFELKSHSFKLTGNVFHRDTGAEATQEEVWAGLTQLFEEQAQRQMIVDGVVEALNSLSHEIDVLFLTNMPHQFADIRRKHLVESGLDQNLITNSGSKAPAVQIIRNQHAGPVGFIDDTPRNLQQVGDGVEGIELFHFMANEMFRDLADPVEGTHFSTGDWREARAGIRKALL